MHIEPGVVTGAKIFLSYGTAAVAIGAALRASTLAIRGSGRLSWILRSVLAVLVTFTCFEVLPHRAVGVSEVHLILGTSIYLLFGLAPAAIGLAGGLGVQGLFFAPSDLPQYGMNVTTLLVPLFAMHFFSKRIISPQTPYVDLRYPQVLKLSAAYQGGIVAWVAFWALYGQGFTAENLAGIAAFGAAYLLVLLVEPLIDLAVLAVAKSLQRGRSVPFVEPRLFAPHGR